MSLFQCTVCGREINHRGNCFPCNKRLKKEKQFHEKPKEENGTVEFPFPAVRESQSEMIADVLDAVNGKKHLVADAPTGLGKTVASLYPTVNYAVANGKTVFFLTSRISQHRAAVETLRRMKDSGSKFSAVDVIGKKHLCSHNVSDMDSNLFSNFCSAMIKDKKCAFFRNFHRPDMTPQRNSILRTIENRGPLNSDEAMKLMPKFCSYEMLMEACKKADVIVGDYFHLFGMGDKFLKRIGKKLEDTIIIVDEAHNLSSRLRNHMSSRLSTKTCDLAAKESAKFLENESRSICKQIGKCLEELGKKNLFNEQEKFVTMEDFSDRIKKLGDYDSIIAKLAESGERVLEEKKISFMDRIAVFLQEWKQGDFGYVRILSRDRSQEHIVLQFNCLDPSIISKDIIKKSHSTLLMSGTLSPMEMHRDLLGMETERTELRSYTSPFPKENRKNIIATGVTTQYKERTSSNLARIATTVRLCIDSVHGNVAVFFPSYEMRNHIHSLIAPVMDKHMILEESSMTKEERDRIREEMRKHSSAGAVLFGVMGGSFSEGIDLPGDLLNGVIILGLPLERPNLSVQALISYYDQRFHRGRDYGYNFPAMIKVMQAAGRCIRSEKDRGVIVFADERFTWKNYRDIFPKSWDFVVTTRPEQEIKKFFSVQA